MTPYHKVVDEVYRLSRTPAINGRDGALLMDKGSAGSVVLEMFKQAGVGVIPMLIHGGYATSYDVYDGTFKVPKRALVEAAQVALQNRGLEISAALPDARVLVEELKSFRGTVSEIGHDRYGPESASMMTSCWPCLRPCGSESTATSTWRPR
jgi:hypothetical protein